MIASCDLRKTIDDNILHYIYILYIYMLRILYIEIIILSFMKFRHDIPTPGIFSSFSPNKLVIFQKFETSEEITMKTVKNRK